MERTTLGGRIVMAREAKGLTTEQAANRLGVVVRTMRNWETDRSEPRANKLAMISGVLGVPLAWLLSDTGKSAISDVTVDLDETATLERKVKRLLDLHQESSMLIFDIQREIRRLQHEIDTE